MLTQASVLTVSSYATRTSPVLRGKWILDNLLNAPPPDPPPDVPNLDETTIGTAASMREQLQAHRKNPTCASCHRRMDPLGFGLENFDAVGAWRTADGKFPDRRFGRPARRRGIHGPEELRAILSSQPERVRRGPDVEAADVRAWAGPRAVRPAHGARRSPPGSPRRLPFLGLVLEIVNSLPFQQQQEDTQ